MFNRGQIIRTYQTEWAIFLMILLVYVVQPNFVSIGKECITVSEELTVK